MPVIIVLVRHCSAGSRDDWDGDDRLRPLDARGARQARALVPVLTAVGMDVRRILSSPYVRCRQSVEPLAAAVGIPVEDAPELAEDTGDAALRLLHSLPPADAVLCSHGDVIPMALRHLRTASGAPCEKGSAWVLTGPDTRRLTAARYLPPPG